MILKHRQRRGRHRGGHKPQKGKQPERALEGDLELFGASAMCWVIITVTSWVVIFKVS